MKNHLLKFVFASFIALCIYACNSKEEDKLKVTKKEVIENYATIAYASYKKAYDDAIELQKAIINFTTTPTEAGFTEAKIAWKVARESYGVTEGFRFANGPIDDEDLGGPEGLINSWPLDENFIDYTQGSPASGIINDPANFPTISGFVLEGENGKGNNEKYVTVGYHAIEFLLWGQDLTAPSANSPGQRPYTDYLETGGTASNQKRRSTYLFVCAELLTGHLLQVVDEWKVGGSYRNSFLALNENQALKNMYLGITTLVSAELPEERMETALGNQDQEDEHSCFSDYTHRDIVLNLQSVVNIYQGNFSKIQGASLEDLVKQENLEVYETTLASIGAVVSKMTVIQIPFDVAISGGPTSTEGKKVADAATALKVFGSNLLAGAAKIGIIVNG